MALHASPAKRTILPFDYVQTLYCEYNDYRQRAKTVEEYVLEFQRLIE